MEPNFHPLMPTNARLTRLPVSAWLCCPRAGGGTLEAAFAHLLKEDLEERVLDFDSAAASEAALLAAERQKSGRSVDMRDTQIAGIALARRATLATRNVRHFQDLKVPVVDPWRTARR